MKRVSLPNANVGTVKITEHKKVNSNEWCYKKSPKVILSEADLAYNLCVIFIILTISITEKLLILLFVNE